MQRAAATREAGLTPSGYIAELTAAAARGTQPGVQISVRSVAVLGDPVDGLHPSDHYGIVCDLTFIATP